MTMDLGTAIQWSDQVELYLKDIGEKSHAYSYLHKASERLYDYRRSYIDIPSITLSTICGTLSIGNSSLFGESNEQLAGVVIGCGSLLVGILGTINSYFSWGKRAENHRLTHLQYGKLFRFIQIELSLPREQRMGCSDLLKYVRETYERLQEISPIVPQHIISRFMSKFKRYKGVVSFPTETNGLEVVEIYTRPDVFSEIMRDEHRKSIHSDVHGTVATSVRTDPDAPSPPSRRLSDHRPNQLFPPTPNPSTGSHVIKMGAVVTRGAGAPDAVVNMDTITENANTIIRDLSEPSRNSFSDVNEGDVEEVEMDGADGASVTVATGTDSDDSGESTGSRTPTDI
jgi:hypothetical protein